MIFQAKNILEPEVIQAMYQVRKSIEKMVTPSGASWPEMCIKIPGNNKDYFLQNSVRRWILKEPLLNLSVHHILVFQGRPDRWA